ncbi:GTPase domain-containing protein [Thermogymnomonas acidicola]|uniref:GTPase domain-containing protein n=1 Tax=Thermogymnomonas acidicola TaxID=399579 RepID=UPI00094618A5|nr:GTPase domain-containing protein [Thermogymnomonas acidicola]
MDADRVTWKVSVTGGAKGGSGKTSLISRIVYDSDAAIGMKRELFRKRFSASLGGSRRIIAELLFQELDSSESSASAILNSNAVMVVVDITEQPSYEEAVEIVRYVSGLERRPLTIIVGNKLDRKYEAVVWEDEMKSLQKKYGVEYCFVAAKNGEGIQNLINSLLDGLVSRIAQKRKANA